MKNKNNETLNNGHDVARHNLQDKLSGYNFKAIMHTIKSHAIIQDLIKKQAIKIVVINNNYYVKCRNSLLSKYRKTNYINKNVTVVSTVNNIITSILKSYNLVNIAKTEFWTTEPNSLYSKVIIIGNDILSRQFMKNNNYYGDSDNEKFSSVTLSERAKLRKYN